jgi:hypothetical protein
MISSYVCFALLRVLDDLASMVAYPLFFPSAISVLLFIPALLQNPFFALYAETRVYSNTLLEYGVMIKSYVFPNHTLGAIVIGI